MSLPPNLVWGYLASINAALGYGTGTFLSQRIVADYAPPMVATAFSLLFGLVIMAIIFHNHALQDLPRATARGWVLISLTGASSAWGVAFLFMALKEAPVVLVAPLSGINPLIAILITHMFLKRLERVSLRSVLGGLLIVVGVALVTAGRS